MFSMTRLVASLAVVCSFVSLSALGADDVKPLDGGKGSTFKSKSYEIGAKSETAVVLSFEAGKEVTVTTTAVKDTDVHLMVKGMYFEAKDTSPSSDCLVKFTPVKGDDKFTMTIKNNGPGVNQVTLKVKVDE